MEAGYYEGDERLTPDQKVIMELAKIDKNGHSALDDLSQVTRNGLLHVDYRWPNNEMAYELVGNYGTWQVEIIRNAIDEMNVNLQGCFTIK